MDEYLPAIEILGLGMGNPSDKDWNKDIERVELLTRRLFNIILKHNAIPQKLEEIAHYNNDTVMPQLDFLIKLVNFYIFINHVNILIYN